MKGPLHTDGTRILDADGKAVRLTGVNDPTLVPTGDYRQPGLVDVVDGNSVRLLATWQNAEPNPPTVGLGGKLIHDWNDDYIDALRARIAFWTNLGKAVTVSPVQWHSVTDLGWGGAAPDPRAHGLPHWLFPNASAITEAEARCAFLSGSQPAAGVPGTYWGLLSDYLAYVARRTARDELVVGIEPLNEPFPIGWCSTMNLDGLNAAAARAIRAASKDVLVFANDALIPKMKAALPVSGWVYSFHHYGPTYAGSAAQLSKYLATAAAFGVPAWCGEFAAYEYMKDGKAEQLTDTERLLAVLKTDNAGWSYYDGPPYALTWGGKLRTTPDASKLLAVLQAGR